MSTTIRAACLLRAYGSLIALIIIACIGATVSVLADWPGHFEPDSVWQLAQARTGVFDLWHPPVMAWLLGVCDHIAPGAGLYIILVTALFFVGLIAFAALARPPGAGGASLLGIVVVAAIAASPLVIIYQGLVLKDVLFADAALAGFAALAWAAKIWERAPMRIGLVALSLTLFTLAALTRQNGVIIAVAACVALGALVFTTARRSGRDVGSAGFRLGLTATCALGAIGLASGLANAGLELRSDHWPQTTRELTAMQVFDLTGAVNRSPGLPLPILRRQAPGLEQFVRHAAAHAYTPTRMDPMLDEPGAGEFLYLAGPAPGAQWRALISSSTGLYLSVRASVFNWVFLTPDITKCAPILVGVDADDTEQLEEAGLTVRDTDKDDADSTYAEMFLGTPVFSHAFYAALAMALLALAVRDVRRGEREMAVIIAMLASALAFTASFFLVAVACDYRYLYFLDLAAMAAAAHRAGRWACPGRRRWVSDEN